MTKVNEENNGRYSMSICTSYSIGGHSSFQSLPLATDDIELLHGLAVNFNIDVYYIEDNTKHETIFESNKLIELNKLQEESKNKKLEIKRKNIDKLNKVKSPTLDFGKFKVVFNIKPFTYDDINRYCFSPHYFISVEVYFRDEDKSSIKELDFPLSNYISTNGRALYKSFSSWNHRLGQVVSKEEFTKVVKEYINLKDELNSIYRGN